MSQETLKFKFRFKRKKNYLFGGLIYFVIGFVFLFFFESNFTYFFMAYGFAFILGYFYYNNLNYVIINSEGIKVRHFIPRRMKWEDYEGMRFFVNDIRVLSKNKTIDINKEFLTQIDIEIIEEELKSRLPSRNN